jgi:hypothetical protein
VKFLYKIAGVIGYFTFKSQNIFSYLNSIEGQFFAATLLSEIDKKLRENNFRTVGVESFM